MSVKTDNYKLINWQYFPSEGLSAAQRAMHDGQHYFDESVQIRNTSVREAVSEVIKILSNPTFQVASFRYACERVRSAAIAAMETKISSCEKYGASFGEAIVCLRIAARIDALKKKILAGGSESVTTALAPYAITTAETDQHYANLELYFKAETEFMPEFAELCLHAAENIFSRSIKYYSQLLEFVDKLEVKSRAMICSSIFSLVMKRDAPQQLLEILRHLPHWKDDFRRILFDDRSNFGWLRQKQMLPALKNALPDMVALILDKEEAFLYLERKIHEHNAAIKTAMHNEMLLDAQAAWKKQEEMKQAEGKESKEAKEVNDAKPIEKVVKALEEIPDEFLCPITQELLVDPVITEAGIIYERKAIELWFQKNDTDPKTRKVLESKKLIPVYAMKALIDFYVKQNS